MTKRREPGFAIDVLLAALEADLIAATDAEINDALADVDLGAAAGEVRVLLVAACEGETAGGEPPVCPAWFQVSQARH